MEKKKIKDLGIITFIYALAFIVGFVSCLSIENIMAKVFVFDFVATVVTFIFSTILVNSSVYDAYWSLTPMIISIWLFVEAGAFSAGQILFLIVFNVWSLRLTLNWVTVFTDFSYEDWRYRKFRDESPKLLWPLVNFFGIHLMPTIIVFVCMLPLFEIKEIALGVLAIPGMMIMLLGILLEHYADTYMHKFLSDSSNMEVCNLGLWKYSRHPNYLGEITFWIGVYFAMIPYAMDYWYYAIGFISLAIMFNVVSIPLMEKRQLRRRPAYEQYCKETSKLILWLPKH